MPEIGRAIRGILIEQGVCSLMLTGGRSAEALYESWGALPEFANLRNVQFYFGDERCVPPDHSESNYGMTMRTLFRYGVPPSCKVIRMNAEHSDREAAAEAYEALLPERVDVLLLSMGGDGHIASLFPRSSPLFEVRRRVVHVFAPKSPFERLTVTPRVITQAKQVFVIAFGAEKVKLYNQAKLAPDDIAEIPARLVLNGTWFFDPPPKGHL